MSRAVTVEGNGYGRRVVLASVDEELRRSLRERLTGMRWQVHEVRGGAEAMAYLE